MNFEVTLPPLKILISIFSLARKGGNSGALSCVGIKDSDSLICVREVSDDALGDYIEWPAK